MIKSNKLLIVLFTLSLILNLSDGIITVYGIEKGLVDEINPIMEFLIGINPIFCVLIKEFLLFALVFYIWVNQYRSKFIAISLATLILITFVCINIWNITTMYNVGLIT